ncbi:MAG: hypothetical protein ACREH8_15920 [Opitutaceae bacterium]
MSPPALPGAQWVERYEALRQHVLVGRQQLAAEPLGLGLVRGRGVVGWMEAWRQAGATEPMAPTPLPPRIPDAPGWQHDLTVLLAEMTVQHLRPIFP